MSARIKIRKGPDAGSCFLIEDEVCRLGSSPAATFRIDGLPDHTLTIHRKEGQFFAINRCEHPVKLHRTRIACNGTSVWEPGQVIRINGRHAFELIVDDDPTGEPDVTDRVQDEALINELEEQAREERKDKANRPRQVVIIGVVLMGLCLILFQGDTGPDAATRSFAALHEIKQDDIDDADIQLQNVWRRMQRGRAFELQGYSREAARSYAAAEKWLKHYKRPNGDSEGGEFEIRAEEFITDRLQALAAD